MNVYTASNVLFTTFSTGSTRGSVIDKIEDKIDDEYCCSCALYSDGRCVCCANAVGSLFFCNRNRRKKEKHE